MTTSRFDVAGLAELPTDELDARVRRAVERIETRAAHAAAFSRDLSPDEAALHQDDRRELESLKTALEHRSRQDAEAAEMSALVGQAIDAYQGRPGQGIETRGRQSPFMLSADHTTQLENARKRFENFTVIETRAALATTDMGTAREYGANGLQAPRSLWRSSGIPTIAPDGYAGVVPQFTLPAGVALVAEGVDHAEFDGVNPDAVTIGRAGAWSTLTSEALLKTSIAEVSAAHARIIARNVDRATVVKIEDSTPDTMSIDEALVTVAAECACDVSDLWIFGDPAAISALVGNATFTPTSGPDTESFASAYGGAKVYPTPLATAERLTVFFPQAFRAFASSLSSGVFIDPKSGAQTFGQWLFYGLGQSLVGGAITIDTTP